MSLTERHGAPLRAGPDTAPDSKLPEYSQSKRAPATPAFCRTAKPSSGVFRPVVPHTDPAGSHAVSTPFALSPLYSIAAAARSWRGRMVNASTRIPGRPGPPSPSRRSTRRRARECGGRFRAGSREPARFPSAPQTTRCAPACRTGRATDQWSRIGLLSLTGSAADTRNRRRRRWRGRIGDRLRRRRRGGLRGACRDKRHWNQDGNQRGVTDFFGNVRHPFSPELYGSHNRQADSESQQKLTSSSARRVRLRSASALCARVAFRQRSSLRIQVRRDFGVASVYIRTKLQAAIDIREGGLVHHKYRHGLW